MIIIATDSEKIWLENQCEGNCEACLLGPLINIDECPIGNKQIIVAKEDLDTRGLYLER